MRHFHRPFSRRDLLLVTLLGAGSVGADVRNVHLESSARVAPGVHLWYEIKADPEESKNLIICGTKWDSLTNGPYGFVYASSDSGSTWRAVLEDRNSPWVTEHSCAFGSKHRAYFVSEASRVFDGEQHHELGVTRLYVSTDAGKRWTEMNKTGWADFSTSAVSSATGRLYTFFNDPSTRDLGRNRGSSIGLLVFSPDGKQVEGSFLSPEMRDRGYRSAFPSDAIALKNGEVSALYFGDRETAAGREAELGFLRADASPKPSFELAVIRRSAFEKGCLGLTNYAMAYDGERDRFWVLYVEGCKTTRMILTSSEDDGRTWSKGVVVAEQKEGTIARSPSLVISRGGVLSVLWSEWDEATVRWLFDEIRDNRFAEPPIELSHDADLEVNSDTLWTTVHRPKDAAAEIADTPVGPSIAVGVRSLVDIVWRDSGLIAAGDKIFAIWPSSGKEGTQLNVGVLGTVASGSDSIDKNAASPNKTEEADITRHVLVTYGGRQSFDKATGTLAVCLTLSNRGAESIGLPIKLEATDIRSPRGPASILNATNGLEGAGATWDISDSITGDRLAPGTSSNPFCVSIHIGGLAGCVSLIRKNLVDLDVRVMTSAAKPSAGQSKP